MLTENAIGLLRAEYRAVCAKMRLLNSLLIRKIALPAIGAVLIAASGAVAADVYANGVETAYPISSLPAAIPPGTTGPEREPRGDSVFGGKQNADSGSTSITVNGPGSKTLNLYGGSDNGNVNGNTQITVQGANTSGFIFGAGRNGNVSGSSSIIFKDNAAANLGGTTSLIDGSNVAGGTSVRLDNVQGIFNYGLKDVAEFILKNGSVIDFTQYNKAYSPAWYAVQNLGKLGIENGSAINFAGGNQVKLDGAKIEGGGDLSIKKNTNLFVGGDTTGFTGALNVASGTLTMTGSNSTFANAQSPISLGDALAGTNGNLLYQMNDQLQHIVGQKIIGTQGSKIEVGTYNSNHDHTNFSRVVLTGDMADFAGSYVLRSTGELRLASALADSIKLAGDTNSVLELVGSAGDAKKEIAIDSTKSTSGGSTIFMYGNAPKIVNNTGTIYLGGNREYTTGQVTFKLDDSTVTGSTSGNLFMGGAGAGSVLGSGQKAAVQGNTIGKIFDGNTGSYASALTVEKDHGTLYAGGGAGSTTQGDTLLMHKSGSGNIYGGGSGSIQNGSTFVQVEGGSIGTLYAGSSNGLINGDTHVKVTGGDIGTLIGGSQVNHELVTSGGIINNVYVDVTGGTVKQIRGGNNSNTQTQPIQEGKAAPSLTVRGDVNVNVGGNAVIGTAASSAKGEESVIGAGGSYAGVGGKVNISVTENAVLHGDIVAGSKRAGSSIGGSNVSISGGTLNGSVFGGGQGQGSTTRGSSNIAVSGGRVNGDVYGGGRDGDEFLGNSSVNISGGTLTGDVYGGGLNSNVGGLSSVSITGTPVFSKPGGASIYGGGNGGSVAASSVLIKDASLPSAFYVYGGGKNGGVKGNAVTTIDNSYVAVAQGGAVNADVNGISAIEFKNNASALWIAGGGALDGLMPGATASVGGVVIDVNSGSTVVNINGGSVWNSKVNGDVNIRMDSSKSSWVVGGGTGVGSDVTGNTNIRIGGSSLIDKLSLQDPTIYGVYGGGTDGGNVGGKATVTIADKATVKQNVYGGGLNSIYAAPGTQTITGSTSVNLIGSGIDVTSEVFGGGKGAGADVAGESAVNVAGATLKNNVYGGGEESVSSSSRVSIADSTLKESAGYIYGGAKNGNIKQKSVVELNNTNFEGGSYVFGGSLNGNGDSSIVSINNLTGSNDASKKARLIAGAMADKAGSYALKSAAISLSNSKVYADVRGGSMTTAGGASASVGNSVVNVSNAEIGGYNDVNRNIWTGRIFGGGYAESNSNTLKGYSSVGNSEVHANNVWGTTVRQPDGKVEAYGLRIYGGGQAFGKNSEATVNSSKVYVGGDATHVSELYGGGIASGTATVDKQAFVQTGVTEVNVTGGTYHNLIVGGNNSNWFGKSVIGIAQSGGGYANGSTTINFGGTASAVDALIVGGSYADFYGGPGNSYYKSYGNTTYERVADVYGKTNVNITGGKAGTVIGGGLAVFEVDDPSNLPPDVSNVGNLVPKSTVYGSTNVNVSGGEVSEVFGGGYFNTGDSRLVHDGAMVYGDTNVRISGGRVSGDVYGGGYHSDVDGNSRVTLAGANIGGKVSGSGLSGSVSGSRNLTINGANSVGGKVEDFNTVILNDGGSLSAAAVENFNGITTIYDHRGSGGGWNVGSISGISGSKLYVSMTESAWRNAYGAVTVDPDFEIVGQKVVEEIKPDINGNVDLSNEANIATGKPVTVGDGGTLTTSSGMTQLGSVTGAGAVTVDDGGCGSAIIGQVQGSSTNVVNVSEASKIGSIVATSGDATVTNNAGAIGSVAAAGSGNVNVSGNSGTINNINAGQAGNVVVADNAGTVGSVIAGAGDVFVGTSDSDVTTGGQNTGKVGNILTSQNVYVNHGSGGELGAVRAGGNVVIGNDGHLNANIAAAGDVTIQRNTSANTLTGVVTTGGNFSATNDATGVVNNFTVNAANNATVDNLGTVSGMNFNVGKLLTFNNNAGATASITNIGTITQAPVLTQTGGAFKFTNAGILASDLAFSGTTAGTTFENAGTVNGASSITAEHIELNRGSNIVVNDTPVLLNASTINSNGSTISASGFTSGENVLLYTGALSGAFAAPNLLTSYTDVGNAVRFDRSYANAYGSVSQRLNPMLGPLETLANISTDPAVKSTINAIESLPQGTLNSALMSISPAIYTEVPKILLDNSFRQYDRLLNRRSLTQSRLQFSEDGSLTPETLDWEPYVVTYGDFSRAGGRDGMPAFRSDSVGLTVGMEKVFARTIRAGIAVNGEYSRLHFSDDYGSNGKLYTIRPMLYANWSDYGFNVSTAVGYGYTSNEIEHRSFGMAAADADYSSNELSGMLRVGYEFNITDKFVIEPYVGGYFGWLNNGSFDESGRMGMGLNIDGKSYYSARSMLGSRFAYTLDVTDTFRLIPEFRCQWVHEYAQNSYDVNAAFNGGGSGFTMRGIGYARDAFDMSFRLTGAMDDNLDLYAEYSTSLGNRIYSNSFSVGLTYRF